MCPCVCVHVCVCVCPCACPCACVCVCKGSLHNLMSKGQVIVLVSAKMAHSTGDGNTRGSTARISMGDLTDVRSILLYLF